METKLSQKDYIKKYLGGGDGMKKKKKKKLKVGIKRVKIIDDDIDLNNIRPIDDGEFDIYNTTEDAPVIAGVIDERGDVDFTDKKRWKIIADDGDGNVAISTYDTSNKNANNNHKSLVNENDITKNQNHFADRSYDDEAYHKKSKHKKKRRKSDSESASDTFNSSDERSIVKGKYKADKNVEKSFRSRNMSDSDLSPPRISQMDARKLARDKKNCDLDLSPPQKLSRSKNDSDSDLSPPRKSSKNKRGSDSDHSPPRKSSREARKSSKNKRGSDSDLSPPRKSSKNNRDCDSDLSPPRKTFKNKKDCDFDVSPLRKRPKDPKPWRNQRNSDSDLSPPRQSRNESFRPAKNRLDRDSNQSRISRHELKAQKNSRPSDFDFSPPRKSRHDLKTSRGHRGSDLDLSPPRKSRKDDHKSRGQRDINADVSPRGGPSGMQKAHDILWADNRYNKFDRRRSPEHRKTRWTGDARHSRSPVNNRDKRMKKTLDGKTAGLQNAEALRDETVQYKKREAELFNKMSAEVSGVGQTAIVRDRKTGKRRDLEAEAAEREEKERRQKIIDEKYSRWGKGLKQVNEQEEKLREEQYEMSKPLARYADDADLDAQLRAKELADDPMLAMIKKKQIKEGKREPDKPSYQGSFMPNRFGIKPGHRWDGVDRGNGYEKKWFEARNAETAMREEAYKWSTSDM